MEFNDLLGTEIMLLIPRIHPTQQQVVKLRGIEAAGLWVESQQITNELLQKFGAQSAPRTPVFFVPYHEIVLATGSIDEPALNEKAFGV